MHDATTPYRFAVMFVGMAASLSVDAGQRYVGHAYARDGGHELYREVHLVDGDRRAVIYQCPDGKAFARKTLDGSPAQPDFAFVDARTGYEEGVSREGDKRVAYVRGVDGKRNSHALTVDPGAVIDAGFDDYIRAHWDEVIHGDARAPFLMVGRGRFYPVKVSTVDARNGMRRVGMRLDAWFGFAVQTITVTYLDGTRQLLRYEGPGTIRDARGKRVDVRIEFPPADRGEVPAGSLVPALALPLDGRCEV